jgi:hypothetical protein
MSGLVFQALFVRLYIFGLALWALHARSCMVGLVCQTLYIRPCRTGLGGHCILGPAWQIVHGRPYVRLNILGLA